MISEYDYAKVAFLDPWMNERYEANEELIDCT